MPKGNTYTVYNAGTAELFDLNGNVLGTDPSHMAIL